MPVLPIPHPMDEVRGFFVRFAEVLVRCLCFHFSAYVVHVVSENHFKLGTWAVTKNKDSSIPVVRVPRTTGMEGKKEAMGAPPPNPLENNKDSNPSLLSRSANNRDGKEKEKHGGYSPPNPQLGPQGPRPLQLAHRILDTTQAG